MRGWVTGRGKLLVNTLLALLMGALYLFTATPVAQSAMSELHGSPVYRGHKEDGVALACAVSWNAKSLSTLLDELKAKGITITFFVSGDWSKENGELLGRMVRDGHELGVMGMNPLEDGDADWVEEDVIAAIEAVNASSGVRPSLYYSGGRSVQPSGKAAARLGILQVLCTVDLLSARGNAQDMLTRALEKPFEGSIILMQPTAEAVRALPACMEGLANKGYAITTVSGVL